MSSKHLKAVSAICRIFSVVWFIGFLVVGMLGLFGDPDKPPNALWLILWLGGGVAGLVLGRHFEKRAKAATALAPSPGGQPAASPPKPVPVPISTDATDKEKSAVPRRTPNPLRNGIPIGVLVVVWIIFKLFGSDRYVAHQLARLITGGLVGIGVVIVGFVVPLNVILWLVERRHHPLTFRQYLVSGIARVRQQFADDRRR